VEGFICLGDLSGVHVLVNDGIKIDVADGGFSDLGGEFQGGSALNHEGVINKQDVPLDAAGVVL